MAPSDVDYALHTLMSKIKERELESQRALNEQEVANRLLKLQVQELQNKLKEKENQLTDANETIRALRSVTQVIAGLQDEIRALRTQLRTSQAHSHRPFAIPNKDPAVASSPIRTRASDDLSHRAPVYPTGSNYISQNSTQECSHLKVISDSGRTTEVAVPHVKQEDPEVEMAVGDETEEQDLEESVKLENNSEWDGGFEYNHAVSATVLNTSSTRKRQMMANPVSRRSETVSLIDTASDDGDEEVSEDSIVLPPRKKATLNDDIVTAFKEWPGFVKTLKDLVTAMKIPSASPAVASSFGTSVSEPSVSDGPKEMVQLPGGLSIPRRMYDRLSRSKMSIFAQELAVIIFGRDTLAKSSLTGRKTNKSALDPSKVNAIIDAVIAHFPGTSPSEIRTVLRRKCNNESFALKGQNVDLEARPGQYHFFANDVDFDI